MFADDVVLIADSEKCLQRMVNEMGVGCGRRKLMVNVNKSKVMKVHKSGENVALDVQMNGRVSLLEVIWSES